MTWKLASLAQLYQIAYGDDMSTLVDRQMAVEEIRRRKKKRFALKQYQEKKRYG